MKPILIIVGTRPEGIKMMPVYLSLKKLGAHVLLCSTTQHGAILSQVFELFNVKPDFELNVMKSDQDLFYLTSEILTKLKEIFLATSPELILVQGDTTTAMVASLAAYYLKIPVGHIEAGLRTNNIYSPFPEEINRQIISLIAQYHFVPTPIWGEKLLKQGINSDQIFCTGNTVVDSLRIISEKIDSGDIKISENLENILLFANKYQKKIILLTMHRRESFDGGILRVLNSIKNILENYKDLLFVFPAHPNPKVQDALNISGMKDQDGFIVTEPLLYPDIIYLIKNSVGVFTDSGGIQEEAVSLNKPVLILRDQTERPEGISAGIAKLVGTDSEKILAGLEDILNGNLGKNTAQNIYGNGHTADLICDIILKNTGFVSNPEINSNPLVPPCPAKSCTKPASVLRSLGEEECIEGWRFGELNNKIKSNEKGLV